jgi:hypothetical protein
VADSNLLYDKITVVSTALAHEKPYLLSASWASAFVARAIDAAVDSLINAAAFEMYADEGPHRGIGRFRALARKRRDIEVIISRIAVHVALATRSQILGLIFWINSTAVVTSSSAE